MAKRAQPLILVVDDDRDIRHILRKYLESFGYSVDDASTGTQALTKAIKERPDAILMDQRLPDLSGSEVHLHLIQMGLNIPTALMSAYPEVDQIAEIAGIRHFFEKPVALDAFQPFMNALLEN